MGFILTFDAGTTAVKTTLFDERLQALNFHSKEYDLFTPAKGIVELDPMIYWNAVKEGAASVLKNGIAPGEVKIITMTTQGETLIAVDKSGKPLCNAVVWIDARAVEESKIVAAAMDPQIFYERTGLAEVTPSWPIGKVLWFKRNRPEIYAAAHKFLLLEDFLISMMTGEFVSHHSLCSSTGYFDIKTGTYWSEMISRVGIDREKFPDVQPCGKIVGKLRPEAARQLGLTTETRVATGAMDQICSAIGAGNICPGVVSETTGTALVVAATTASFNFSYKQNVVIYRHFNDTFLILPSCTTAGVVLKWFKDEFCGEETAESEREGIPIYNYLDKLAMEVPPLSNGLVILPHFAGKLNPDVQPNARGIIFGLSLETRKKHFIRAILESVGYMLRENLEIMENAGIPVLSIRSLGGGSKSPVWNSIKADICGKEIVTMENQESTSLGAAILGAVAQSLYGSVDEALGVAVRVAGRFSPDPERQKKYETGYALYRNLYDSAKHLFEHAQ